MRALAAVACVVAAIAALWLSFLAVGDLCLTGFPEGHLTDYDKAVDAPKRVLMWLEFGFVPLFLVLVFARIGTRDGNLLPARRQGRQVEHELSAFVAFEVGGELAPPAECRVLEILGQGAIGAGRSCDANDVGNQVGRHHHGVGH